MFGYATDLRSSTQGRATYTMQFERYEEVPTSIAEQIVEHGGSRGARGGGCREPLFRYISSVRRARWRRPEHVQR